MTAALAETGEQQRVKLEIDYADLSSNVHSVIDSITLHGMAFFGEAKFRVDNIEEDTLEIARGVLQSSIGEQLPRFYTDEDGNLKELGSTPVIEPRHAEFIQEGEVFEGWNGKSSASLRLPTHEELDLLASLEPQDLDVENQSLSKRERVAMSIMSLLPQLPGYSGLIIYSKTGDWEPAALGVLMSTGLNLVALLGIRGATRAQATD